MNRLILIGNGFDLAHGLKTSYHDFILDLLKECFIVGLGFKVDIEGKKQFSINNYIRIKIKETRIYNENEIKSCKSVSELKEKFDAEITYFEYNKKFLSILINTTDLNNWVDIESLYYIELKKNLKKYYTAKENDERLYDTFSNLVSLNQQLDFIKTKLEKYLKKIYPEYIPETNKLRDIIHKNLEPFVYVGAAVPGSYLFLNFNYTSTPSLYSNADKIINIHGELDNENNPIIFGYGDEVDKSYEQIEDLNENEFFKHIKSFDYFKTSNYHNLLNFIDSGEFEIFIMGHSCGLSDRTMLSTIFEHKNCKSIKIFYYKDYNNYRERTYEISRHFNDKASMRDKIVDFKKCSPMPQHDD